MIIPSFSISRLPRLVVGRETFSGLPDLITRYGRRALLVTGARAFQATPYWQTLQEGLRTRDITWEQYTVAGEPSPVVVDDAVRDYAGAGIQVVVGIGGGSALDAAKAIAGLLRVERPVGDYLEGVGPELPYLGPTVPFIAVPTTAGTGSEATKNAVLSLQGPKGYKKSFRDERLVAEYAVVDPALLTSCPPPLIAANGMDALTQLLESYVSTRANPFTDALVESGLAAVRDGLIPWYEEGPTALLAQDRMAYAALLSGITLAQTGLGSVHGLAAPLGAFFPIPHGVACGTLLATATEINLRVLAERSPHSPARVKYATAAEILCGCAYPNLKFAGTALVKLLADWSARLDLPLLSRYGVNSEDVARIVTHSRGSSMQTNPIILTDAEVAEVVERHL
ncbi:Iron-containing alcohol dehydrogenase [Gammaproteobacteria bacterium]